MHTRALLVLTLACCGESRPAVAPTEPVAASSSAAVVADAAALVLDAFVPQTLDGALAALRARGLDGAADMIAKRVAQRSPKMRLTTEQGRVAAIALLDLAELEAVRALHAVMPRSTVELARAVRERGVPIAEAETIARYLVGVVQVLGFERLGVFDDNHSHVIGREWHEIDYTGENMTWEGQRDDWSPRGVTSFETATSIHAYFVGAERLPHWKRVYRPRGRMADVTPP